MHHSGHTAEFCGKDLASIYREARRSDRYDTRGRVLFILVYAIAILGRHIGERKADLLIISTCAYNMRRFHSPKPRVSEGDLTPPGLKTP